MGLASHHQTTDAKSKAEYVTKPREGRNVYCNGDRQFRLIRSVDIDDKRILRMDEYSAANAFVNGELTVQGDLCAAIRFVRQQKTPVVRQLWFSLVSGLTQLIDSLLNGRNATARNIRFHYDRSNAFYRQFLDSRMLYSAGHFSHPGCSLEEAQIEKLDCICQHLSLRRDERFLDVGCGWGALVVHAAERFGAQATGCTLSRAQLEFARA